MAINATKKQTSEPIAEGAYPARIYQIIHIGTVAGFQGQMQNKARITFEFPTELKVFDKDKGELPMVLSQDYTLSFSEKANLKKVIDACDPKGLKPDDEGFVENYDIEKLLGKACLVTIKHKAGKEGAVYANIDSVTVLPKGMECPPQVNKSRSLSYDNFDVNFFQTLPEFVREKIKSSVEYQDMVTDPNDPPFEDIDVDKVF